MSYPRDVLAKEILMQLLSGSNITPSTPDSAKEGWVKCAYVLADAMLVESQKPNEPTGQNPKGRGQESSGPRQE